MHSRACVLVALLSLFFIPVALAQTAETMPYLNPGLSTEQRVDDLISRMTLEEKASQLVNQARAIPRLQVPEYDWWSEALHGVANAGTATVFPEPIGLAATFDAPLIHEMAVVIGTEARAKHNQAVRAGRRDIMEGLDFWSPNINIFRDPRWGRGQETYGEDPFLTGTHGRRVRHRPAGRRSEVFPRDLHAQTFRGAQRSGADAAQRRCAGLQARHGGHISAGVPRHGHRRQGRIGDVRLQPREWRAGLRQSISCSKTSCAVRGSSTATWCRTAMRWSTFSAATTSPRAMAEAAAVSMKTGMDNECADFFTEGKGQSDYVKYVDAVKQGLLTREGYRRLAAAAVHRALPAGNVRSAGDGEVCADA